MYKVTTCQLRIVAKLTTKLAIKLCNAASRADHVSN